jgi:hypothetical protein
LSDKKKGSSIREKTKRKRRKGRAGRNGSERVRGTVKAVACMWERILRVLPIQGTRQSAYVAFEMPSSPDLLHLTAARTHLLVAFK